MGMIKLLKPCPFCGKIPTLESCDRIIQISCDNCHYTRIFYGLISFVPSDVPVRYEGGVISTTEFYHADAHEKAIEAWNTRKGAEDGNNHI
jgi:hypothetical protein